MTLMNWTKLSHSSLQMKKWQMFLHRHQMINRSNCQSRSIWIRHMMSQICTSFITVLQKWHIWNIKWSKQLIKCLNKKQVWHIHCFKNKKNINIWYESIKKRIQSWHNRTTHSCKSIEEWSWRITLRICCSKKGSTWTFCSVIHEEENRKTKITTLLFFVLIATTYTIF